MTSEPREDAGDGVFGAPTVLDFDQVLHEQRDPPADRRAAFRLLRNKQRERFMVGAEDERATKKVYSKVLSSGDDCEELALKCRIILLERRQYF